MKQPPPPSAAQDQTTTAPVQATEQLPAAGGSYARQSDGRLLPSGTTDAEPDVTHKE